MYHLLKQHPTFFSDIHDYLISLCMIYLHILDICDLYIHIDSQTFWLASDFKYRLDCINLHQPVDVPTHINTHLLDKLPSSYWPWGLWPPGKIIQDPTVMSFPQKNKTKLQITFWNIKSIDLTSFNQNLHLLSISPDLSKDELGNFYNISLSSILDIQALVKTRTVTFARPGPWFMGNLRKMKQWPRSGVFL